MGADGADMPSAAKGNFRHMPEPSFDDLKEHISTRLRRLKGNWVGKHSGYEAELCKACAFACDKKTFWDATWKDYRVELKRGTSIWIDLVRLSRVVRQSSEDAKQETLTLFFVSDKQRVQILRVIGVPTPILIRKFGLTDALAADLLRIKDTVPKSLNAQASLSLKDVQELAVFAVQRG